MIVTCPRCFAANDVTSRRLPDHMVEYLCNGEHGNGRDHSLIGTQWAARWTMDTDEGVTDELLDPLLACLCASEPFVEYGVVEYRFRRARPDLFVAHVRERAHVMLAPAQATASSVRFAATGYPAAEYSWSTSMRSSQGESAAARAVLRFSSPEDNALEARAASLTGENLDWRIGRLDSRLRRCLPCGAKCACQLSLISREALAKVVNGFVAGGLFAI